MKYISEKSHSRNDSERDFKSGTHFLTFPLALLFSIVVIIGCNRTGQQTGIDEYIGEELTELKEFLAQGWNTWNTRSVVSHVLLPESFAIDLQFKDYQTGEVLKESLIGRGDYGMNEHVIPGPHAYDGSYTELELKWKDIHVKVQSATDSEDLLLLVTPIEAVHGDSMYILPAMLWGREGEVAIENGGVSVKTPVRNIELFVEAQNIKESSGMIRVSLSHPVAISSGSEMAMETVQSKILSAKTAFEKQKEKYDKKPELYNAMQTVLAWDLIYEPTHDRVIAPVSRTWNVGWEGWILFDWDTYFAAYMFALDNKELAYANAVAITNEITDRGFIPNFGSARNTSEDRSQPPVGSFVVKEIYKKYQEKWFLSEVFDELLSWNRWWHENRNIDGYLVWGSDPYEHGKLPAWLEAGIGTKKGAKWESGLDNSPMWDDAVFDSTIHRLMLADVGLMSFYIYDCQSLSEIATVLGKKDIAKELNQRAATYSKVLETLWNEEKGIYMNKDLVSGEFSPRLSPTLFYPLFTKVPSQVQAERMMKEHFYNPEAFWGDYIIPSIARNDPAFKDNDYWRGRIWAPMNFLVYLGMRNYDLPDAQQDLVEKSEKLLLQSWEEKRYVCENYDAITGEGGGSRSDAFYHWGAMLGYIGIIDAGYIEPPETRLEK